MTGSEILLALSFPLAAVAAGLVVAVVAVRHS